MSPPAAAGRSHAGRRPEAEVKAEGNLTSSVDHAGPGQPPGQPAGRAAAPRVPVPVPRSPGAVRGPRPLRHAESGRRRPEEEACGAAGQILYFICQQWPRNQKVAGSNPTEVPWMKVRFDLKPKPRAACPVRAWSEEEPLVVTVIAGQPAAQDASCAVRTGRTKAGRRSQEKRTTSPLVEADGHPSEEVELNTTLAYRAKLEEATGVEFDAQKAVQEKLQTSEHTKNQISTKAADAVNFPRSQQLYQGLVSVSLSHDQLISHALQHRPSLAPPTRSHGSKTQHTPTEAPDLLAFCSPAELLRESPMLPGNLLPLPRLLPEPRPAHTTFDLYRRCQQWEA
ncbi:protein phosphatase 1 regulatory subunit 35 [Denticeps clupeoides]|uniref:protein phosphatase 1 regulatory subunit 35 n=1 Tax=Denticeps clupeoides TaxID=299321 RepID=UPI0010A46847|nr:protein phosphatase 1 regulatory subunit 35 [Denticeps clupeoides]